MNENEAEIRDLRGLLYLLEKRVVAIESKLAFPADLRKTPVFQQPEKVVESFQPKTEPILKESAEEFVSQATSFEARIGLYWLSRLGIGCLVIGIALLIMYSFQYFGAAAKLITGYLAALILFGLSEWLERKGTVIRYTRMLAGGGWSLAYFTTFAMHYVNSVRVIEDPALALLLMLFVAGLSVWHALVKRSQLMSIFAVSLGYFTFALNPATTFSAGASFVLVLVTAFLVIHKKWYRLLTAAVCSAYIAQIWIYNPSAFFQDAAFLLPYLLCFSLIPLALSEKERDARRRIILASTVNALAFTVLFLSAAHRDLGSSADIFHLLLGAFFLVLAWFQKRQGLSAASTVNWLAALVLGTNYLSLCSIGNWLWPTYALEMAMLVFIGFKYDVRFLRWFALIFSFVVMIGVLGTQYSGCSTSIGFCDVGFGGMHLPLCLFTAGSVMLSLSYCAYISNWRIGTVQLIERRVAFYAYAHMEFVLAFWLPVALICGHFDKMEKIAVHHEAFFLLASWTCLALIMAIAGSFVRSSYIRAAALFLVSFCGFLSPFVFEQHSSEFYFVAAGMYVVALVFYPKWRTAFGSPVFFRLQFLLASLYVWFLALRNAESWAPCIWSLEGMLLLVLGFYMNEKSFRISGLFVFGILILRLLVVDLAGAETIYRILAFILAGIVLLASAFCYAWFSKQFERVDLSGQNSLKELP